MKLGRLAVLVLMTLNLGSCSSGNSNKCEGSLSEVGAGCPAMFDGTYGQLPACSAYARQYVFVCGQVISLVISGGYASGSCFYDSTSHKLVGAQLASDIPHYCGNSYTKSAGTIAGSSCDTSSVVIQRNCPGQDAGTN
jgi:hypothetical protein